MVNALIAGTNYGYDRPFGLQIAGRDLSKPKTQKLLVKELFKTTSVHVDVACHENGSAVKQLIDVLETNKVKVFVDERAQPALTNNNAKIEYLVYAENLNPDDLSKVLGQLGAAAKSEQVESVQVSALTSQHRSGLSRILGVDEKNLQAPPPKPMNFHNPIEVPKDKKEARKNGEGTQKTNGQANAEALALVMVLESGTSRSAQVQRFLASRRAARPGSLQVVMVVRA